MCREADSDLLMVVFHDENGAGNQGGGIWMKDCDSSGGAGSGWLDDRPENRFSTRWGAEDDSDAAPRIRTRLLGLGPARLGAAPGGARGGGWGGAVGVGFATGAIPTSRARPAPGPARPRSRRRRWKRQRSFWSFFAEATSIATTRSSCSFPDRCVASSTKLRRRHTSRIAAHSVAEPDADR